MPAEPLEARRLLAAGDLVTSFGTEGILAMDFDSRASQVMRAVAQLPDGDLILSGESADFGAGQPVADYLARVNADGSLDSGFSGDGILLLPEDEGASGAVTELTALPDGDILYSRRLATAAGGDVVRLNPDGSIDEAFGSGGRITISGFVPDLALLPSNQIVVAGGSIVRVYEADGSPRDDNFQTDLLAQAGISTFTFGDVSTDDTGGIYVAGGVREAELRASVFKLSNSLALDSAYGDSGEARRDFFTLDIFSVASLDVDSTGRAVIAINEDDAVNVLARFSPTGELEVDRTFRFTAPDNVTVDNELFRVLVQPDGKIIAGGNFADSQGNHLALARLIDAQADPAFGGDPAPGEQRYGLGRPESFLTDMTFTNDDDLLVVGHRIAQPSFDADAVALKVDLGDIGGDGGGGGGGGGDGGGGNGIGDVSGFSELDGSALRLTGTARADSFTWTTEQIDNRPALVFIRADVGSGASSVTAKYFRDDVESLIVSGLEGDDAIELTGLDLPATLLGGAGNDRLVYDGAAARLEGDTGNDLLQSGAANDVLFGGDGQDALEGNGGNDTLDAGAGPDSLSGGAGVDSINAGDGDDIVGISNADGDFTGDSVSGDGGKDTLDFTGRTGGLVVQFGDGGFSASAFEVLVTGDSDDELTLDDSAGAGMIEVRTGGGNDSVDAGARSAPVRFISGPGADTLNGGGGADVFLPGAGGEEGDVIFGGGGLDTLDFASATSDLVLTRDSIGEAGPTIQIADDVEIAWAGSGNDDLFGFLRARGGAGNDSLTGARDEDSALFGDEGDDGLFSLFINGEGVPASRRGDYLEGGAGNDTLSGGIGADTFAGGNGNDAYDDSGGENVMTFADVTSDSQTGVTIDLSQRSGNLVAGDDTDSLEDVFLADVIGTRYADEIRGNEQPNYLVGGDGNDTLVGGDQKDILLGGAGSDQLDGGDDFDLLLAFSDTADESPIATDTLAGGAGFDTGLADEADEDDVELLFTSLDSLISRF